MTNKEITFIIKSMETQKEIAKKLNVTHQHLNAVLRGRTVPSINLAIKIEKIMGIPVEDLIPALKKNRNRK